MAIPGRLASVVLVHRGQALGLLPPVSLDLPWWPESHDLVSAVRERDGIDITVLRLLHATSDRIAGGEVTYLAETSQPAPWLTFAPVTGDPLAEHPLRQPWARPGGPAELLSWADARLADQSLARTGPAEQMRSWNLSALWRIPTDRGRVWLKAVPAFFAHEGAVIDWINEPVAPRLVNFAAGRTLMADIPGATNHDEREPTALHQMVELLTRLQQHSLEHEDELIDLGVPDRRFGRMLSPILATLEQWGDALEPSERRSVEALASGLPARFAAVTACGVPDTLVHGDFHSGNVAGRPGGYVILDWGDSFVGHPLIDELAFVERLAPPTQVAAREWFVAAWRRIVPGSDPGRAVELLEPVVCLLAAVMYARFCAAIEPAERVYHASDLVRMLRQAAIQPAPH